MSKYALYVKEGPKWMKLTKPGHEYSSKTAAENRKKQVMPETHKKIGIRKIQGYKTPLYHVIEGQIWSFG